LHQGDDLKFFAVLPLFYAILELSAIAGERQGFKKCYSRFHGNNIKSFWIPDLYLLPDRSIYL